ncbi:extracellular solute-binding protein [Candidatus Contubernalis alkaliaceticus]|uniref:extracellular solute-binding protein n=1 Tax=Candidatus Contubernalis alkaliaceticus TaxID=338645 RepID=UPI001F4C26E1|nr:extracellular solute-binding protein [Candidatus Contubernalis alkalaceticus]UNC93751.1 extracellular solute-binding protein [Candidatus Contubernalis alkalaceticus]
MYTAFAGGDGPVVFDFLCLYYESLIDLDIIAPVDWETMGHNSQEEFAGEWFEGAIEGVRESDGNFYSLPFIGNTWSLYINREHFEEAGLDPVNDAPKTWEELKIVAEQLTVREDGKLVKKGYDLPYIPGAHWWMFVWGPLLAQHGGSILSEDGSRATINEEPGVKALQDFYDLVHKHKVTEPGITTGEAIEDFMTGLSSMWIAGPWARSNFEGRDIVDKYMVAPLPQVDLDNRLTFMGGYWWFVSNKVDSEMQKEGWKFLQYLTSDPGEQFERTGLLMPKPGLLESESWKEFPFSEVFSIDLEAGIWPESSPVYPEIEKAVADAMERSLIGDMDPQESLDIAAEEINRALQE